MLHYLTYFVDRYFTRSSQDGFSYVNYLILPTVKADPRTSVPVLIANIRNQMGYTPSYRKAWIAKQKALEKMHSGWDAS